MDGELRTRIERMFGYDRLFAWVMVVLLWLTTLYVVSAVDHFVTDKTLSAVLYISALAVLVFNTASIIAMVSHYRDDKDHIYGLDIRHLDEQREARSNGRAQPQET
jgi:hypothetical protein